MLKNHPRIRRYTLVEILVALAILTVMMYFLFQFIIGAQKIWTASHRTASIFEQTQLFFYLFENDLKSALLQAETDHPGRGMLGYLDNTPANQLKKFGLITQFANPPIDVGVYPVVYAYDPLERVIRRKMLDDPSTLAWTFFGSPDPSAWISFYESVPLTSDDILAEGVSQITLEVAGLAGTTTFDTLPATVKLTLTLYDANSVKPLLSQGYAIDSPPVQAKIDETSRSFTKVIFLQE